MSSGQLLYKHTRPWRITIIRAFAWTQSVVWSYMAYNTYDMYKRKEQLKKKSKTTLSEDAGSMLKAVTIIGESSATKAASWFAVGAGFTMTVAAALWCRQSIKSVYLLNRNRISINTYGFPKARSFTIPIAEVQSVNPEASPSYLRLRVSGEPLQYIIDRDGEFPRPKLFHTVTAPSIGL